MKKASKFNLPRLSLQADPIPKAIDLLVNQLTYPAILANILNNQILLLNKAAREELIHPGNIEDSGSLEILFENWDAGILEKSTRGSFSVDQAQVKLATRDKRGSTPWNIYLLDQKASLILLIQTQPTASTSTIAKQNYYLIAEKYHHLFQALTLANVDSALDLVMTRAIELLGINTIAIYTVNVHKQGFVLFRSSGESEWLPKELTVQEYSHIISVGSWETGQRPNSILEKAASTHRIKSIQVVKLGQNPAVIGCLILGNSREGDINFPNGKIIAALISTVFEKFSTYDQLNYLEAKIDEFSHLFSSLEGNINEGLIILNPNRKIIEINKSAELILGYNQSEIQNVLVDEILISAENLLEAINSIIEGSELSHTQDIRLFRRSGESFIARISLLPISIGDEITHLFIFIADLSEQERIREHNYQLEQRSILGEITAVFAHEVRNPINNISTGLDLLDYNLPEGDPNKKTVQRLLQDCDRLVDLMKSILSYSRPAEYTLTKVSLAPTIINIFESMQPKMTKLNIHSTLELEPDCPLVYGNLRALEQVFVNLVNNAIQAMSEKGGQIAIKIGKSDKSLDQSLNPQINYVDIKIIDTGPGISSEYQDKIFQPFFTTNIDGTGLGLAITKRIINSHNGIIRLTSIPGGTIFQVSLPAVE